MTEDPKRLWQDQPKEGPEMGLEQVQTRLRQYRMRALRSRVLIVLVAMGAVGIALAVRSASLEPGGLIGDLLMLGGILVVMAMAWRRTSPPPRGDDAAAGVAYLRARLLERRRAARGGWVLLIAPIIPGIVVRLAALSSAAGAQWWPRMGPILGLVGLWIVLMLLIQWRQGAKVSAEIGELDRLNLG
jgi:hypothetical protein